MVQVYRLPCHAWSEVAERDLIVPFGWLAAPVGYLGATDTYLRSPELRRGWWAVKKLLIRLVVLLANGIGQR